MNCPCEHPCHPVECCGNCHTAIGPWCADWEPSPRLVTLKSPADILRDARPDPYTKKASFLLGWDAAIAALERMK